MSKNCNKNTIYSLAAFLAILCIGSYFAYTMTESLFYIFCFSILASMAVAGFVLGNQKEKQKNGNVQLLLQAAVIIVYVIVLGLIVWFNPLAEIAEPMNAVFLLLAGCIISYAAMVSISFISANSDKIADRFSK